MISEVSLERVPGAIALTRIPLVIYLLDKPAIKLFKEAFPSDVWIKRIVSYLYFDGKDIKVEKVREFGMDEFGDYAGYIQLYMFHYARKSVLMERLK